MLQAINVNLIIDRKSVIKDINLSVSENERIGIIGLHHAGKTLLMEVLAGDMKPTKGKVLLDGEKINKLKICYIPQFPKFPLALKAKEIMSYLGKDFLGLLDEMEIDREKKVKDMTFDEKRRLYYALSLPFSPKYLLIDDISFISRSTREIVSKFKGGVIIAHHNLRDVWDLVDKIVIMSDGKIVFSSPKEDFEYKIIKYKDENEKDVEAWVKLKDDSLKKVLIERGIKFQEINVTPDEVFLHFYARS